MIVHGTTLSPYCRKVAVFAAEKNIAVEMRGFRPGQAPAIFHRASPFGKMPALEDGDFLLSDSSAIVHYLEARQPEPNLIPVAARPRGRAIWFEELADTVLMDAAREVFANRFLRPRVLRMACDHAAVERAMHEGLPKVLAYLETVIPDSGFLVEDRLTLADIAVASPLATLRCIGVEVDAGRFPRAAAYVAAIHARPSFAAILVKDQALVDAMGGPV